ncbi:phosphoadenylyl-sulfate reductase [Pseudorhodoplanes sp.]|uniref:phosphoadenylyl-sulfate reductase n=1 Tax=Pseudorhodoplanes sp. TaxID=1934341 RepID=UPI0039199BFE
MTVPETLHARVARLNEALASASPAAVIEKAMEAVPAGRLAVVSSFGTESAVLLKFVADVDPGLPVLFLDTGMLFEETLDYRDRLVDFFGLTDVRSLKPQIELLERRDPHRDLWLRDTESCCHIRKVRPLSDALGGFDGWMNGRKRFQGGARAAIAHAETDGQLLKFNPLAALSQNDIAAVFETAGLPRHPLEKMGFSSVGCMPCTSRTRPGEAPRAGRWRNTGRSECGIHRIGLPAGAGCGC